MSSRFYDLLTALCERPPLYLGQTSVTSLEGWIAGWQAALGEYAFEGTKPYFWEFHDWVALRLNFYESTSGWRRMLLKVHSGDEEKAFEHFVTLFHEFLNRVERVVYETSVDPKSKPSDWVDTEDIKVLPWPSRLEIIKYTDDAGVFLHYLDQEGGVYRKQYCRDLENAFWWSSGIVDRDQWISHM